MIEVGQKYHDTKVGVEIELLRVNGPRILALADDGRNAMFILKRFEDAIGTRFVLVQKKNQSGYTSLDKAAEKAAVLSVHKVDEGIWIKLVDGGAITVSTCKEAKRALGVL